MSQVAIKFTVSTTLAHRIRQEALRRGTNNADIVRRCCDSALGTVAPKFNEALVETHAGKHGKVVGAALSGALATAVARLAAETGYNQSSTVRYLLREGLKARGLYGATEAAPTPDMTIETAAK